MCSPFCVVPVGHDHQIEAEMSQDIQALHPVKIFPDLVDLVYGQGAAPHGESGRTGRHQAAAGFDPLDRAVVEETAALDPDRRVGEFVFRVDYDRDINEAVDRAARVTTAVGRAAVVDVGLPRGAEGVMFEDDDVVAARVADMARRSHQKVTGVLENMSGFTTEDGKHYAVFGSGGGKELADDLGVPLIGQIPLDPESMELVEGFEAQVEAAIGVAGDIWGGSAISGPNAAMAARIASLCPWACSDASSVIKAKNQNVFPSPRWYE